MHINIYEHLPKKAQIIREKVFMKEQGFHNEFDEIDSYAKHLVLFDKKIPVATCRFFNHESCEDYFIGRIAVIKEYRGKNIGATLLKAKRVQNRNYWRKENFFTRTMPGKKFLQKARL